MEQIFELAPDDDITSIRSRLEWSESPRILIIVPRKNKALRNLVNLKLLARTANQLNLKLGLMTQDATIRDLAEEAQLNVYTNERSAQVAGFISPKAQKAKPEKTAAPQLRLVDAAPPPRVRIKNKKLVLVVGSGRVNLWQQLGAFILVGIFSVALVLSFLVLAPAATITLIPEVNSISSQVTITADPNEGVTNIDRENNIVPARPVQVELTLFDEVETLDLDSAPVGLAKGEVVLINRTQAEQTIPISTAVRASSGIPIEFVTTRDVTVPAGPGSIARVGIVAQEPGPIGNVAPGQINRFANPALGFLMRVLNESGTGGGTVELTQVVSEQDKVRLQSKLRQVIQQAGYEKLLADINDQEFVPPESLEVIELSLSYNQFSGDATPKLGAEMRAVVRATAINNYSLNQLAYYDMLRQIPPGQTILPETLQLAAGGIETVNERAVTFPVQSQAYLVADLDKNFIQNNITGKPIGQAQAWMADHLPIISVPGVDVNPNWLGRLPIFPYRINIVIQDIR